METAIGDMSSYEMSIVRIKAPRLDPLVSLGRDRTDRRQPEMSSGLVRIRRARRLIKYCILTTIYTTSSRRLKTDPSGRLSNFFVERMTGRSEWKQLQVLELRQHESAPAIGSSARPVISHSGS